MRSGFRKTHCQILLVAVVLLFLNYHVFYNPAWRYKCDCKDDPPRNQISTITHSRAVPGDVSVSKLTTALGMFTNLTRASNAYGSLLYGKPRSHKGFLTLGIPSVRRPNGRNYLLGTIKSIIDNTDDYEKTLITVVVYLADYNVTWNVEMAKTLYSHFTDYFEEGMLQIIIAPMSIYPDLRYSGIPGSRTDNDLRTKWRSKQNLDFAFVMLYSKNISKYYVQLEDDVVCALNFVSDIETFVNNTKRFWICLEFTELGFIGKLFRSIHLERLAHTLLTYYDAKPCDLLLGHVYKILGQKDPIHSHPSLFQHMGKWSSLEFKMMPSIDKHFKGFGDNALPIIEVPRGDNPKANLITNMDWSPGYGPEHAYNHSASFFWAKDPLRRSFFEIVYRWPMNIRRIIISTGDVKTRKDTLRGGSVKVSETESCHMQGKSLGSFVEGEFDSDIFGSKIPRGIRCIAMYVSTSQGGWLILRDIAVFVS